jgi:hypothetical protein
VGEAAKTAAVAEFNIFTKTSSRDTGEEVFLCISFPGRGEK